MLHTEVFRSRCLLLLFLLVLVAPTSAESGRDIPDDNLAYPVLIEGSNGNTGSGFYLNTEKATFLVTALHVLMATPEKLPEKLLSPGITCLSYAKNPSEKDMNLLSLDLETLKAAGDVKWSNAHDVVVVRIGNTTEKFVYPLHGVEVKSQAKSGLLGVGTDNVKIYSDALVGNEVFVLGYPVSIGLQDIPQLDYKKPLLRKGIIAGKNDHSNTLVLDLPTYPGNSGGPVLEVESVGFKRNFRIVGVVTQSVPVEESKHRSSLYSEITRSLGNSGYSVAVSMDSVLELIRSF